MSKKIIYLLSLLMALSLVFASCKKNNGVTGVQGNPNEEDNVVKEDTGGLQKDWASLDGKTILNNYAVIGESGGDYYRNPVIVSLGEGNVLIVAEKRINYPGSANDIGVNGDKPVSIVYLTSSDAGDNFSQPQPIGGVDSTGKDDAVSAPVVFYKRDDNAQLQNKVVVIASAGSGISRTGTAYTSRNPQSQLKYVIGTVGSTVTWGQWKDLDINSIKSTINSIQFGTHSGRGVVTDSGKLVLPVITANQGTETAATEMMGVAFFEVSLAGDELTVGTQIGKTIAFDQGNTPNFSKYKEAKAVGVDSGTTKVTYLAVPNPEGGDGLMGKGEDSSSSSAQQPTAVQGLKGSEGSFGFLKFAQTWYGANPYDPAKYKTDPSKAGNSGGAQGEDAVLFSHVQTRTGANYLYMLDPTAYTPKGSSLEIAKTSKSSSIDVLPDGTVIVAAEKEKNPDAEGNKFNIFFSRYTQQYIANQIQPK